ncbi:alpha/beta hydrolase [Piscirickettsia litoralis]|uniref:Alpha/beta hydrolase n=2 Tax=Piscirickettsia litoralis TaxID=1891921 RepID=A0ABX3A8P7_9GAMM|nr:alpha/beta hydrolase [Piscirickettsia litoralis]
MKKRNVVLIHGWGASSWVWQPLIAELSADFNFYPIDLPGYGKAQNHSFGTIEQVVTSLFNDIPESSLVIGWSLGGLIARQLAMIAPDKVQALITIASPPCFVKSDSWNGLAPEQLLAFKQALVENVRRVKQRFCALQIQGSKKPSDFGLWSKHFIQDNVSVEALSQGLEVLRTADFRGVEADFEQPQLHLYGDCDRIAPFTASYYQKTGLNYQIIMGAAHLPLLSHLHELVAQVRMYSYDKATI